MLESNILMGDNVDLGKHEKDFENRITKDKSELNTSQRYAEDINLQVNKWVGMSSSSTMKSVRAGPTPRYMTETATSNMRKSLRHSGRNSERQAEKL